MGFSIGGLISDASNVLTGGAVSEQGRAMQAANPLGTSQMQAYGQQLVSLMANPQGGTTTPLAGAQATGAAAALKAGGLSDLSSVVQPYIAQLQGLDFNSYLKDLGVVSGAAANGPGALAQMYSDEAAQRADLMGQLGGSAGGLTGFFGGGGGSSGGATGGFTDIGAGGIA